ncbi:NCS2 family permease [Bacillus sp. FJAT-42376]|uniref:NCS2 family permease n=1 Tax=Bacillus sp. FJAT-42376 TaxID=2014076 RepID=UPI000F4E00AF|nr:NCS2 family permease [Bacillus sp. FJAT-42376]AZB42612.1 NCS2 family permease [Bacillus sp. FJAT-42376]
MTNKEGLLLKSIFQLKENGTTFKRELLAGLVSFLTVIYIVAVNASILSDAGIPLEAGMLATVLASFIGCLLMGLIGNTPIILVPGMGVNALFTYTICQSMGIPWQQGLAVVIISGLLFAAVAFTKLTEIISASIPSSLKEAITVGIGIFLTFIGLQKAGMVEASKTTFVQLGDLSSPAVLAALITLLLTIVLFAKGVPGHFLISIVAGTAIAYLFGAGAPASSAGNTGAFESYANVLRSVSFEGIAELSFWIAVFSLTMVIVFENVGLVHGHTSMISRENRFKRSLQANSLSAIASGFLGTSPTVSTVETAAGISAGGRTGLTALTTGLLFLASLLFLPYIKLIPDTAIAPILILIGGLMIQNIQNIDLQDFSESFPAFLIIALIPLTYSIVDGMAFGFIAYPILKVAMKRSKEIAFPLYIIALLFLASMIFHSIH